MVIKCEKTLNFHDGLGPGHVDNTEYNKLLQTENLVFEVGRGYAMVYYRHIYLFIIMMMYLLRRSKKKKNQKIKQKEGRRM